MREKITRIMGTTLVAAVMAGSALVASNAAMAQVGVGVNVNVPLPHVWVETEDPYYRAYLKERNEVWVPWTEYKQPDVYWEWRERHRELPRATEEAEPK